MEKIICTKKNSIKNRYYLGSWAVENDKLFEKKTRSNTFKYHWDDQKKLDRDYKYLEKFTFRTTKKLSKILNKVHGKNFNLRYWEFLLFPWILANNSIIFDRWESISKINPNKNYFCIDNINFDNFHIKDYHHLINLSQQADWNEGLYLEIIKFKRFKYKILNQKILDNKNSSYIKIKILKKIFFKILSFISPIFFFPKNNKKKLLLNTQYSYLNYKKFFDTKKIDFGFNFLEKINNFFIDAFEENEKREKFKYLINKEFDSKKGFEKFFWKIIPKITPKMYLENFDFLYSKLIKRKKYNDIYTSFSHFNDLSDKFYIADQIIMKKKIYVFEHGGSLPAFKELFYFEEKIFDKKYTFYKPLKKKQKLIKLNPYYLKFKLPVEKDGDYCCIFCGETPMWNYRVQFYATSSQSLNTFDLTSNLIQNLYKEIKLKTLIKTKNLNSGFNFRKHYKNKFGNKILYNGKDTKKFISKAKFLILTYPETTLVEAVLSKKPFIIIYNKNYYKRHIYVKSFLKKMKDCNILFEDPLKAAKHLNENWKNPNIWFESKKVQLTISSIKKNFFPQGPLLKKIDL